MFSLLTALGLGDNVSRLLSYALPLILLGALIVWLRHDAYRDGVADERTKWKEALAELNVKAEESAEAADVVHGERAEDFAERLEKEKEKLDEAEEAGTSPIDALFPVG